MRRDAPIPARILNEHVYCPRLAYLMWRDGAFQHNAATVEGALLHERVDRVRPTRGLSGIAADGEMTSVYLTSEELGVTARLDAVRIAGSTAVPIEIKRGRPYTSLEPLREPEKVQLAAHALLLEAHGYTVPHAEVVFPDNRSRGIIELSQSLFDRVHEVVREVRAGQARDEPPPRLIDNPKCGHCVLVGICLPDEIEQLQGCRDSRPRRLVARDSPARPLYLLEYRARLVKRGERLQCELAGQTLASARLLDVSHVVVIGNATVTSPALRACFGAEIPVLWMTYGGRLSGVAAAQGSSGARLRLHQYRRSALGASDIAAQIIAGKIRNQRTLVRRHRGLAAHDTLSLLARLARRAIKERSVDVLLGLEGAAARAYFAEFGRMLDGSSASWTFDFTSRNRRPPRDPVNAMLSFVYALLLKDAVAAVTAVGFDPSIGLFHKAGYARPALALDLIEEFRPLIGDSTVLRLVKNGEISANHFVQHLGSVSLTDTGRRAVIAAYERRMAQTLVHPFFRYPASYRRLMELQARILAATVHGEIPHYRPLTTR